MCPTIDPFTMVVLFMSVKDVFQNITINKFEYFAKQAYF